MTTELTGRCQCGAVTYRLKNPPFFTVICHCIECQRLGSSAFTLSQLVHREDFEHSGELACFERDADSGATAYCYFCPKCGNRLYHDKGDDDPVVRVKMVLEQRDQIRPRAQVFATRRQPWLTSLTGGVDSLPAWPEMVSDRSEVMRGVAVGYLWTAMRRGVQLLGLVCIGIVGWQLVTG